MIEGKQIIGFEMVADGSESFHSFSPATGDKLSYSFNKATSEEVKGFPTGVEVCHAMVQGGPYLAPPDGRSTSVGTAAIHRFTHAVCYQGLHSELLPAELKNEIPLNVWRLVYGQRTQNKLGDAATL